VSLTLADMLLLTAPAPERPARKSNQGPKHHKAGERTASERLTDAQVRKIRELRLSHHLGFKDLAQRFGCGEDTARNIVRGLTRVGAGGPIEAED
jgi:AraC-like DNA-binding protein